MPSNSPLTQYEWWDVNRRELVIGSVCVLIGIAFGVAVCPKQTGTPVDKLANYVSGFYILPDGTCQHKHAFMNISYTGHSQAILMESRSGGKVIGYEYYIQDYIWNGLSPQERGEWHPCKYSVKSGLIYSPDLSTGTTDPNYNSRSPENLFYDRMSRSYVKTIIFWTANAKMPSETIFARPLLSDDDWRADMIAERDRDLNINTNKIIRDRSFSERHTIMPNRSK